MSSARDFINNVAVQKLPAILALVTLLVPACYAQEAAATSVALYRRLGNLGIDKQRIYKVRDASLNREDIHISLNEGMIGFLEEASGEITGAVFVGEGEVLLVPPNYTEKQSLALFTKSAVLNEKFTIAFLRFTDSSVLRDLEPALRSPEDPAAFLTTYDPLAHSLSAGDVLRVLMELTKTAAARKNSQFLRARLNGVRLGIFDVLLDSAANEQVFVGQLTSNEHGTFYDQLAMFPMRSVRRAAEDASTRSSSTDEIIINSYKISTQVIPPTDIAAEALLDLHVQSGGSRTLVFELSRNLKVSSVLLNGTQRLEVIQNEALEGSQLARRGNDLVAVVFAQPLTSGQKLQLTFKYAGPVMSDAGNGLLYVGSRGIWFPNRGPWMSTFDLEFRVPTQWRLLATGKKMAEHTSGNEEVTRWRSERPGPVAGFNLGKYVSARMTSKEGTVVEAYAARGMGTAFAERQQQRATTSIPVPRPFGRRGLMDVPAPSVVLPDPARNTQAVAKKATATIEYLVPKLGPFPFSTLALTQIPGPDSQGWPGLVFLSSYVFLSPEERWRGRVDSNSPDEILFSETMAAHETAHQWWGNNTFYASYRDQWLMEALANYSALMKLESESPERFRIMLDWYRDSLLHKFEGQQAKDAGAVTLGIRLNSSKFPNSYEQVAYGRGTWLIHMLRHMYRDASTGKGNRAQTGNAGAEDPDAVFFSVLREVQRKYSGQVLSTAQFQAELESALPRNLHFEKRLSLDWFFDTWVGGTAIPKLELEHVRIAPAVGGIRATALLKQSQAPEQLVTSVPIYARATDGKLTFIGRVFSDGPETEISLTVPAGTRTLVIDPQHTVLRMP